MNNSLTLDFYFYQFLTNRYQPSFVEMHFKFCDMINADPFFGASMRRALGGNCPYPPGEYDMTNLSIPFVPKSFPFVKGRIYCNVSFVNGGVTLPVGGGSIDMEIKITYISVEHPQVTYYHPKYLTYANLTSVRYGRSNPVYYVGLNFVSLVPIDSNIYVDVYFHELLTNQYKRSFIEFHFNWCYLTEKDMFFGAALRAAGINNCPLPPGPYNLNNMTINPSVIPKGFPFTRGRIYANFTHLKTKDRVADGYIDMRLATVNTKNSKSLFE
ncbi:hypothetical protein PYW08_004830 [Mythimna loreyi]|uniref:Uncharacterized protein n=1 Tax=Mythimna loreyi TaxID=667449 RepID=A0ACC2QF82_9NEOP|nr:hypothetical protein PYW08_004830 [Mythimna loreyi]